MDNTIKIKRIYIKALHGKYNFDLDRWVDNSVIFVAYNGAFKSTILKIIYLFLSVQLEKLDEINFESITVTLEDGKSIHYEVGDSREIYKDSIKEYAEEELASDILNSNEKPMTLLNSMILETDDETYRQKLLELKRKVIYHSFPEFSQIYFLYLPTYRVIEKNFQEIYSEIGITSRMRIKSYVDELLIKAGVTDVYEKPILPKKEKISQEEFDKLTHEYNILKPKYDEEMRKRERLYFNIWNDFNKVKKYLLTNCTELSDFDMNNVQEIINVSIKNERKQEIENFVKYVNKYLSKDEVDISSDEDEEDSEEQKNTIDTIYNSLQKKLAYDSITGTPFILNVKTGKNTGLDLDSLSSGEKQIVTLFAYLLLTDNKKFFVIYDEPELSLSILWQENLLGDIMNLPNVMGMLSATHSPHVIQKLLSYSRDLTDFIKEEL